MKKTNKEYTCDNANFHKSNSGICERCELKQLDWEKTETIRDWCDCVCVFNCPLDNCIHPCVNHKRPQITPKDWEKEFDRVWENNPKSKLLFYDKIESFISSLLEEQRESVIEKFCKENTVIEDFECGEHGIQKPMPSCPKCTLYGGREGLVEEIRKTLCKEIEKGIEELNIECCQYSKHILQDILGKIN